MLHDHFPGPVLPYTRCGETNEGVFFGVSGIVSGENDGWECREVKRSMSDWKSWWGWRFRWDGIAGTCFGIISISVKPILWPVY